MSGSSCGHARTGRENAGFPISNAYYNIQIDCRALDLKSFDVVGFSLGGMIAQQLAFEYPDMIRRIKEQAAIAASKAAAARGEFATDEQVRAVWAKHGL